MNRFPDELKLIALPPDETGKKQIYKLDSNFRFLTYRLEWIEVPEFFETDFASIPKIFWNILDPEEPCILFPSLIHDFLYSKGDKAYSRKNADIVLRSAMNYCGAPKWKSFLVYYAVRIFGKSNYET